MKQMGATKKNNSKQINSGQWCTFGRTVGRAWLEWIYSQGFYFEPRAGGEVRIFGVYNNKQTNKQTNKTHDVSKYVQDVHEDHRDHLHVYHHQSIGAINFINMVTIMMFCNTV